uniref:LIM zinc-binding domain-containing protein n=1 Tax=Anopheles minimus TaxID=112268 RepID=A0A182W4H9_9DIPT
MENSFANIYASTMKSERRMSNERNHGSYESSAPVHQQQHHEATEHDAVNNRFIEKRVPEVAYCLSCRTQFSESLPNDIIQHYINRRHEPCCRCLYCNGPMYRYRDSKDNVQYYHDCHRYKRFLDAS